MNKKLMLVFAVLLAVMMAANAFAEDCPIRVIYIIDNYGDTCGYRQQVVDTMEANGYYVTVVKDSDIPSVNWDDYDLIVIGEGTLNNRLLIPLHYKPTLIFNFDYLSDWNIYMFFTQETGSSGRLRIDIPVANHSITGTWNGTTKYVYNSSTDCQGFGATVRSFRKAGSPDNLITLGTLYSFSDYIVVSAIEEGSPLKNGYIAHGRIVMFGITDSTYWTSESRTLFLNSLEWLSANVDSVFSLPCGEGVCTGVQTCDANRVWSDCSTSGDDAGVCAECDEDGIPVYDQMQDVDCDDSLWCNGPESCSAIYQCSSGTAVNCSPSNKPYINTCNNNPDNNPFTRDYHPGFTSVCDEQNDRCTTDSTNLTHTCDNECDAECESDAQCMNKCVGNTFYFSGTCDLDGACGCSYITENCDLKDGWYNTTTTQWINTDQCNEKEQVWQEYREYGCSASNGCQYSVTQTRFIDTGATRYEDDGTTCSDGEFCSVGDSCQQGLCVAAPRDCSIFDLATIASCDNDPDSNPFTWDSAIGFTSVCDEDNDICTTSTYNYTHVCDPVNCGAECDADADCAPKCVEGTYYYGGTCDTTETCGCSFTTEDCDLKDGWYNTTITQWVSIDWCNEKQQLQQEYRDYTCSAADGCSDYTITSTRWVDNGSTQSKVDGTACNDGLFCTTSDVCTAGVCGGVARTCGDNKECTNDFCNEAQDVCQHSNLPSGTLCGYPRDCTDDRCVGYFAEFYPIDGHDTCDGRGNCKLYSCEMEDTFCSDSDPFDGINSLQCGAECDADADCAAKCVEGTYYYSGTCGLTSNCACSYSSEDCDLKDGWYNTTTTQWINTDQCNEKEQQQEEYRDYGCSASVGCTSYTITETRFVDTGAVRYEVNGTVCNDGLFCTTSDVCTTGVCGGSAIDCSDNSFSEIATCGNAPDSNPFTWDYSAGFTSVCDEQNDRCTTTDRTFTHVCDPANCGAECDADADCAPKCVEDTYYYGGTCDTAETCGCSFTTEDCDLKDGWYNTTTTQWINTDQCNEKEQQEQEYRDYACSTDGGCTGYTVTDTRFVDTGSVRYEVNGTVCNDGLFCTTSDVCTTGVCGGSAMDCSGNSFGEIATCTNIPDGKSSTWDYSAGFTSVCDEQNDRCTTLERTYTHTCDPFNCGAECDADEDCVDKCVGDVYYYAGACDMEGSCGCEYDTTDCNQYDGWYDTGKTQWVNTDQCNLKQQKEQEYRNHGCSSEGGCEGYVVTSTQWIDTGATQYEENGTVCNDGLFCTTSDVCTTGVCGGSAMDCSGNSFSEIATCGNDPDSNPFTWDYSAGFTSVCDEQNDKCTTTDRTFTHVCDPANCGAECDADADCAPKCVEDTYYYGGTCDTAETCGCSFTTEDCDLKDGWYNTTTTQWINTDQCNEKEQQQEEYRDYSCSTENGCTGYAVTETRFVDTGSVRYEVDGTVCNDGLFCTTSDVCTTGVCGGSAMDCSDNSFGEIATCGNAPDSNPFTWDYSAGFTSVCDEQNDRCTTSDRTFTHVCDPVNCGAECDADADCAPKCVEDTYYYGGTCDTAETCGCSFTTEDCDLKDGWYNTTVTQWINTDQCNEKEQQQEEYRDYSCSTQGGCTAYTVTETRFVDTGSVRYEVDGTVCNDGLFCTTSDVCTTGVCGGSAMDCSDNSFSEIATCGNAPDSNPFTWDYSAGFTSVCDEQNDRCTTSDRTFTHVCDPANCGAECDADADCAPKCVEDTYYYGGTCDTTETCGCSFTTEDCDLKDGWYNTTIKQWINTDQCNEKEQQEQEYRDYACSTDGGCTGFTVSDTRFVDTGSVRYEVDGTACNDGLFCTTSDVCTTGVCGGSAMDCSEFSFDGVNTCGNNPDNNPFTKDYAPGFTSVCDEELDRCTTSELNLTHTCDICDCGAECEDNQIWIDSWCGPATEVGECQYGTRQRDCSFGCTWNEWTECVGAVYPADEICDGLDNDCDGVVDNGMAIVCSSDSDCGASSCDAFGTFKYNKCVNAGTCGSYCTVVDKITDNDGDGFDTECDGDCDDNDPLTYPDAPEILDGKDQNCRNDPPISGICVDSMTWPEDTVKVIDLAGAFIDTDGDVLTYYVSTSPDHVSVSVNGTVFSLTPALNWFGTDSMVIGATDGEYSLTGNTIDLFVTPVNDAPVLDHIPGRIVTEGDLVTILPSASDVDGDVLTFSFTAPFDASGNWQTNFSSSGTHTTTVAVSDGNGGTDSQDVVIIVQEWGNHAPLLDPIAPIVVNEGELVKVIPSASDIDGDSLIFTFTYPLNSSGEWKTNYSDSGSYTATVTVYDGKGGSDSEPVSITVLETGNHAPELQPINDITVYEGQLIQVTPHATDIDGDALTYTFGSPLDTTGRWQTSFMDSGVYPSSVGVSDGNGGVDTVAFTITVLETGNHAPILQDLPDITIIEGEKVGVRGNATDPDGDTVYYTYSAPLDSNGDWQTDYTDQGSYTATVTAYDGKGGSASKTVRIHVLDWGNHAPELDPINDITVFEGELVAVVPVASDVDGDSLVFSYAGGGLGSDGRWQTTYEDSGVYPSTVTVTDGRGATASRSFIITVLETGNHAPILAPIQDIYVYEGELVHVDVDAYDPDGDNITVTFTGPLNQDGDWQTEKGQIGEYDASVIVSDGLLQVESSFRIIVMDTPYEALQITSIQMPDYVRPGEELEIAITTTNVGTKDMKNVRDRAMLPDLGLYGTSRQFDLKAGARKVQIIRIDIPEDAQPGEYDVRFTISNDVVRRTKFRPVTILPAD